MTFASPSYLLALLRAERDKHRQTCPLEPSRCLRCQSQRARIRTAKRELASAS